MPVTPESSLIAVAIRERELLYTVDEMAKRCGVTPDRIKAIEELSDDVTMGEIKSYLNAVRCFMAVYREVSIGTRIAVAKRAAEINRRRKMEGWVKEKVSAHVKSYHGPKEHKKIVTDSAGNLLPYTIWRPTGGVKGKRRKTRERRLQEKILKEQHKMTNGQ